MPKSDTSIDKVFFGTTIVLVVIGLLMFGSASLSVLLREQGTFYSILVNQLLYAIVGLIIAYCIGNFLDYRLLRKYALTLFIGSLVLTLCVFLPVIGFSHGGAHRWINLGFTTFQPGELLKLSGVIYFAAWLSMYRSKIHTFTYGLIPLLCVTGISGIVFLLEPDTDTFVSLVLACVGMYVVAGCRWRDIGILTLLGTGLIGVLALVRPYIRARLIDFFVHTNGGDLLGQSYQVNQSLIAIGSGQFWGRGFGQSIQKFGFLPESISDSIFAVIGEETGFVGASFLILIFILLALRGLKIANKSTDAFGGLLTFGIVILILSQAFMNIGAMLGLMPLSGLALTFISHGGTALLMALIEVGIILSVSKRGMSA